MFKFVSNQNEREFKLELFRKKNKSVESKNYAIFLRKIIVVPKITFSPKVEKCRAKMFDNKKRVIYIKGG